MQKFTKTGRAYAVEDKHLVWTPEVWPGEPALPEIRIPLRMKLGLAGALSKAESSGDVDTMSELIGRLAPGVTKDVLDEMDVADFGAMFEAWGHEFQLLQGATLGEASASPSS